jgi:hypothetical protein
MRMQKDDNVMHIIGLVELVLLRAVLIILTALMLLKFIITEIKSVIQTFSS